MGFNSLNREYGLLKNDGGISRPVSDDPMELKPVKTKYVISISKNHKREGGTLHLKNDGSFGNFDKPKLFDSVEEAKTFVDDGFKVPKNLVDNGYKILFIDTAHGYDLPSTK